jgi:hypothetical protein
MSGMRRELHGRGAPHLARRTAARSIAVAGLLTLALGGVADAQSPRASGHPASIPAEGGPLVPGTYRSTAVGDTTFEVADGGWIGTYDVDGAGFGLVRDGVPGTLDITLFVGDVFAPECGEDGMRAPVSIDPTPEALMRHIQASAGVTTVSASTPVTVGGLDGLMTDITTAEVADCPGPSLAWLVPVLGRFFVLPGSVTRIIALDGGDRTVVIIADAPTTDAEAFLGFAQPVIDSMAFGSPGVAASITPSLATP